MDELSPRPESPNYGEDFCWKYRKVARYKILIECQFANNAIQGHFSAIILKVDKEINV